MTESGTGERDDVSQAQRELGALLRAVRSGKPWEDQRRHLLGCVEAVHRVLTEAQAKVIE